MNRRTFLSRGLYSMGLGACTAGWARQGAAQEAEGVDLRGVQRFTETVDALEQLPAEKRQWLAQNPEWLSPDELNARVPAITKVELKNDTAKAEAPEQLRVITWNIERGRAWRDCKKLIDAHPALQNPDVLLISEMDLGMQRSANEHTTQRLAEALGMNYAYGVEFLELARGDGDTYAKWEQDNTWGYHGNAVLARFPLANVRMLRFPGIERWYGSGEHRLGGRNCICATIDWQGTTTTLMSTHFESGFGNRSARVEEAQMVVDEIEAHAPGQPVIFGGDLNDLPSSSVLKTLVEGGLNIEDPNLLDTPTIVLERDGRVVLAGGHIDYLATRGVATVKHEHSPAVVLAAWPNHADGALLSDHAAVAADLRLPG